MTFTNKEYFSTEEGVRFSRFKVASRGVQPLKSFKSSHVIETRQLSIKSTVSLLPAVAARCKGLLPPSSNWGIPCPRKILRSIVQSDPERLVAFNKDRRHSFKPLAEQWRTGLSPCSGWTQLTLAPRSTKQDTARGWSLTQATYKPLPCVSHCFVESLYVLTSASPYSENHSNRGDSVPSSYWSKKQNKSCICCFFLSMVYL
eukprot:Lithocolla_globosa_v1_NODE_2947_length_1814_cov_345.231950.p2 type:complete len:202 gc:universal NODE_2947_length_1814_cov_345.231950:557-1162(+)